MTALRSEEFQRQSLSRSAYKSPGSVLVLTIWSLFLLSMFSIYLGYGVRQKLTLAYRLDERDRLRLIAGAGVKRAMLFLAQEESKPYASLSDGWSDNVYMFKDMPVGDGAYEISYHYKDEISNDVYIRYGLTDEEGKININKADQKMLRRLFKVVLRSNDMEAQRLAASIVDWRDGDGALSIPIGSAEDKDYRGLLHSYEAKDSDFEVLEELLLVNGMDEEIFKKIRDYITIYGEGKVNVNTASKAVLLALGLGGDVVYNILRFRYGEDMIFGTDDDGAFTSHSSIVPQLSQTSPISMSQLAQLTKAVEQDLVVNSSNFRIRSIARLERGKGAAEIVCIADKEGNILYWHES